MNRSTSQHTTTDQESSPASTDDGIIPFAKEVIGEITDDDVPGLAAEVAYHAIFSIPALLVVLISLAAIIDNIANVEISERLREMITENAPSSTQEILTSLVDNAVDRADGGTASIGLVSALLVAFWAGSNGIGALMKAFNRAYNTNEERSFPKKKAAAVLLTIVMGLTVNLAIVLWVFGGQIGRWLASEFAMGSTFDWIWNLSRIPAGIIVIVFMLGILYYFGPTSKQEFRWVLPGAVFSTVVWGLLVFGFSIYLQVASPGSAYGVLSGVIIFLFFLYLTSLIFLVGAEFNAGLARRYDEHYQQAIGVEEQRVSSESEAAINLPRAKSVPSSVGSLAIGAVATIGIVIASLLRRRGP